ncbi:glycosyltransferase [Escherichia albertii]|uniref:glycosyltransferase n=1 Tax=Escherichia albertii TaxID=208962 RepID=UPI0002BAE4B7|nr:glycosyltransferase [Escherichia albertii]
MNIIVFNTLYYPNRKGGAERSVQLVCEELASQGEKVSVVSLWDKKSPKIECLNGVNIFKWSPYNIYSVHNYCSAKISVFKKALWQLIDLFNIVMFFRSIFFFISKKPDVIWTNNLSGFSLSVWVAAFILRVPVCHTARDYYLLSNNVQLYKDRTLSPGHNLISKIKVLEFRFLSRWLDAFIGISDYITSLHKAYAKCSSYSRIYNSVYVECFSCKEEKTINKVRIYGYLGQINNAKGVDKLINHFLCNTKNSILLIAGKDEEGYAEKYIHSRVRFVGFKNPIDFFEKIDCLVVPSLWDEPFGRIVIEAIANMTPVLCTKRGGLSELSKIFSSVNLIDFDNKIDYDSVNLIYNVSDEEILKLNFSNRVIVQQYLYLFRKLNCIL